MKQFLKSFFLGVFSTGTDFLLFGILNYWLLIPLRNIPFKFLLFDYGTDIGGLCTFIATAVSFMSGCVISYFIQKKYVFKSNAEFKKSITLFLLSSFLIYLFTLYFVGYISAIFASELGDDLGPLLGKGVTQFIGFLIQFFLNKYIILTRKIN